MVHQGVSRDPLWCHIGRCSSHATVERELRIADHEVRDEAEIEHFDDVVLTSPLADHYVRRLDVAMDQTGVMGLFERPAHLAEQMNRPRRRQPAAIPHEMSQVGACNILHREIEDTPIGPTEVEDLNRIGMGQLTGYLDFTFEAGDGLLLRL